MNVKLTLAMDKEIIEKAKHYAAEEKTSLSAIVEGFLKNITDNETKKEVTPIVKGLTGVLKGKVGRDWKSDRDEYLENKYK